jgi:hypothetical protein
MTEAAPVRIRRVRTLRESLLSIVLGMEAAVMFFVTLVIFGLHILEPLPAFLGGGIAVVVLIALAGVQRHAGAVYVGAAAQLGLILLGLLTPVMYLIGAGFSALWLYCFLRSRQIERQRRLAAESESS